MTPRTRVLIVDDHELVRTGLRGVLSAESTLEVVAEAADGVQALAAAEIHHPDVVVMDLQMPEMDGIEATRRLLAARPATAVLVVTMFDDDDSVFAALRAGARGYVLRGAGRQELRASVIAVASGQTVFGPGVAAKVMEAMLGGHQRVDPFPELTERERQVLQALVDGSTPATAGRHLGISEKTVRNNISSILTKLHVVDRHAAMALARERGAAGPPSTGRRALLFAELDNATALARQLGDRYASVVDEYNRLLDASIASSGGRSFKVSADTRLASFSHPAAAVGCAVATVKAVSSHSFPGGVRPVVRVGVHSGTVTDDGDELVGLAVQETARVAAAAAGGEVMVSEDADPASLPAHLSLRDAGVHELQDLDRPLRIFVAEWR